ncbi:hypothetical protein TKK_0010248 [Trichogramma kaykai]
MIHQEAGNSNKVDANNTKLRHHGSVHNGGSLLATAMAHIVYSHGTHVVRILIDPGSEVSFVTSHVVDVLALKRVHSSVPVSGIGGCHSAHTRGKVTIALKSMHRDLTVQFSADILNKISSAVPSMPCDESQWSHFDGLKLADASFGQPRHVDVLIGADVYPSIIKPNIIYGSSDEPMAQLSIFGWLAVGPIGGVAIRVYRSLQASTSQDDTNLDDLLTKFWTKEEVPASANASLTPEEAHCENHFVTTHSRDSTGRYVVPPAKGTSISTRRIGHSSSCLPTRHHLKAQQRSGVQAAVRSFYERICTVATYDSSVIEASDHACVLFATSWCAQAGERYHKAARGI